MIILRNLILILSLSVVTNLVVAIQRVPSAPLSRPVSQQSFRRRGDSFLLAPLRPLAMASRPVTSVELFDSLRKDLSSSQSKCVSKRPVFLPSLKIPQRALPHRILYGVDLDVDSIVVDMADGAQLRYPNLAYAADERIADLYFAVALGALGRVKELVEAGVNYMVRGDARTTPLMHACANVRANIVEYLLTLPGVDVNAQDAMGYTALYFVVDAATKECNLEIPGFTERAERIIYALAKAGINFEFKPNRDLGRTAFELAVARYCKNSNAFYLLKVLLQAGAKCRVSVAYQECLAKIKKFLTT